MCRGVDEYIAPTLLIFCAFGSMGWASSSIRHHVSEKQPYYYLLIITKDRILIFSSFLG